MSRSNVIAIACGTAILGVGVVVVVVAAHGAKRIDALIEAASAPPAACPVCPVCPPPAPVRAPRGAEAGPVRPFTDAERARAAELEHAP